MHFPGRVREERADIPILPARRFPLMSFSLAFLLAKKVEFENNKSISNWKEEQ
jgi:hypothetical protein